MTYEANFPGGTTVEGGGDASRLTVLVIDPCKTQRRIVCSALEPFGSHVLEAASGPDALRLTNETPPDLIISDEEMTVKNGVDVVRDIRRRWPDWFIYVIVLTGSGGGDLSAQLHNGADDCSAKPVQADELYGRALAAARLIRMDRELRKKNTLIQRSFDCLKEMQGVLDQDLAEARKLQRALAPSGPVIRDGMDMSFLLQPSDHVGGDLIGWIPLSGNAVGFYAVDVSGYGISSALLCARISAWFRGETPERNMALSRAGDRIVLRPPDKICADISRTFYKTIGGGHSMTMAIGEIDMDTGRVSVCLAGHPRPVVQRAGGEIAFVGPSSLPIGMIEDPSYESIEVRLSPGDRILIYSDGMTGRAPSGGAMVGEGGLARILRSCREITGSRLFEAMTWELERIAGAASDDISGVLIEVSRSRPED